MPRRRRSARPSPAAPAAELRGQLRELTAALTAARLVKLREARRAFERDYVRYAIARAGGRASAARELGIGLSTLKEKIRRQRAERRGALRSSRSTRVAPHPERSSARR